MAARQARISSRFLRNMRNQSRITAHKCPRETAISGGVAPGQDALAPAQSETYPELSASCFLTHPIQNQEERRHHGTDAETAPSNGNLGHR